MKAYVSDHLASVNRRIHFSERDRKPTASVILSRQFGVEPRALWNAITSPEEISKWFAPVTGQLGLGGAYQIAGNASGIIKECNPLIHVALTWEFADDVSCVDLQLMRNAPSSVSFELSHTAVLSPHWDQYGAGATGVGWETSYLALYLYLQHPSESLFDEEEFVTSDEGKDFISKSSIAWAEASILAGADAEVTKAAADRTTAFYLGQEGKDSDSPRQR